MTRQLRQRHRRIMLALVVILPIGFVAGLLARRPVPIMSGSTEPGHPQPSNLPSR